MSNILYYLKNALHSFFRYFKYDSKSQTSILGSIFAVAILVIIFGGLITVFLKYGVLILLLILPYLLARVTCKSNSVKNTIALGLVIIVVSFFLIHWIVGLILWVLTLIYAVMPEKINNIPEGGFF